MVRETGLFTLTRANILRELNESQPISISNLCKKTNLGRATIYHHLKVLKRWELITEEEERSKIGHPIIIKINHKKKRLLDTFERVREILETRRGKEVN